MTINKDASLKNNIIFWMFFSSIFLSYIMIDKIHYILYIITMGIFIYDFSNYLKKKPKINTKYLFIYFLFISYLLFISILNFKHIKYIVLIKDISIYICFIYVFFKLSTKNTNKYVFDFFRLFAIVMNFFCILDLIEIFNKRSLFYNFIFSDAREWQVSFFGTGNFRTFSIFLHPIIYSVFLVILFWCNNFIIKNKIIKFLLNFIVIINLFFTKSRSSWIAFIIIILIYYLKNIVYKICFNKVKISYKNLLKKLTIMLVGLIFIIIFFDNIEDIIKQIIQRFITVTSDSYGDISRLQRIGTIKLINNYMVNNGLINFLFGNGLGSAKDFMMNHKILIDNFVTTDNQYLSIFYETGFVGLIGYILLFIIEVIKFFKNDIDDINNLPILCFLIISITMFFFEASYWINVLIFLVICICFSIFEYAK